MAAERVIAVGELAPGEVRCVTVGGLPICLAHTDDGEFYAIDDECSHEEASLSEGWLSGHEIECPRHNSMFDLRTGVPTSLPAVDPLRSYAVTIEDDHVFVDVDAVSAVAGPDGP